MGVTVYRDLEIRGQVFPTARAAALHFGVTPDTVRLAARKGRLHRLGTGESHPEPCPVRIRGTVHASARAAAEAFGLTPSAIHQALAQGRIDSVGLGARCPHPHRARPITLGGVRYPSLAAADRALGFGAGYVSHAIRLGRRAALERIVAAAMAAGMRRAA